MQQMNEVDEVQPVAYQSPSWGKGSPAAQDAEIKSLKKMMWLQMVFLGALFITQVIIGIVLAAKVDDFVTRGTKTADDADTWMAAMMETGNKLKDTADIITNPTSAANLIGGTVSTMMLGRPEGSVAAYLQDMTENDYGAIASTVQPLADYIRDNLKTAAAPTDCDAQLMAPCPAQSSYGNYIPCTTGAVGEWRYCYCSGGGTWGASGFQCNGAWQQDCTPDQPKECLMVKISNVAAAVSSVLDKAKTLERVTPENDIGDPAMSTGLLRLNWMANWTVAQGGPEGVNAYKTLSKQCKSLVANVLKVPWTGSFVNTEGTQSWDANSGVRKVTDWVSMFCNALE